MMIKQNLTEVGNMLGTMRLRFSYIIIELLSLQSNFNESFSKTGDRGPSEISIMCPK